MMDRKRLHLEELEHRTLPATTAGVAHIALMYETLLRRDADLQGLTYFSAQLDAGASPLQVAQQIAASTEFKTREVDDAYRRALGREADPIGSAYFIDAMNSDSNIRQVRAAMFGSNE